MFVLTLARNCSIHEAREACCASVNLFWGGWSDNWIVRLLGIAINAAGANTSREE